MKVEKVIRRISYFFCSAVMVMLIGFLTEAYAGVVPPSGGWGDHRIVQKELDATGSVVLQAGATYYFGGCVRFRDNYSLDATGATIYLKGCAVRNYSYTPGYDSLSNVVVKGGRWLPRDPNGIKETVFSFAHSSNIKMLNLDIECTNAHHHAVELVACDNVLVQGCTIIQQGTSPSDSSEEALQIDLATPRTAGFLKKPELLNGLASRNVRIIGNTVTGNRAVSANYSKYEPQFKTSYYENIVIKDNILTGVKSEALTLYNIISGTVSGNTIITKSKAGLDSASTVGLYIGLMGNIKEFKTQGAMTIANNTIKGGRQALDIISHNKSYYKKMTIRNNKLYCKRGKLYAIRVADNKKGKPTVKQVILKNNKIYKWK